MQSYEAAGGYGLPAYYEMGLGAEDYAASSLMAAYGLPGMMAATQGFGGFGGMMGRGRGAAGMAAGRGGMLARGRGGLRGGRGGAAMMGLGAALRGRGAGGRGGGRVMRGRGGAGAQRFNPLAGQKKPEPEGNIVFVYNIGEHTGEQDVRELFSLYGTVTNVDVIWDYAKNITKGYAFVCMPQYEEAEYAIQQLNGYNYAGKPLQVSFKSDKKTK